MEWRHTVWPEGQLVYTATAKVANTSLKAALLETFSPTVSRRNPHASDVGYVTVNPDRIGGTYPGYLHIAAARNPFDRLVSFWSDKIAGSGMTDGLSDLGFSTNMSFEAAARRACELPDEQTDPHIRSQSFLLLNNRHRLRVDVLLRFEHLEEDWDLLRHCVRTKNGAEISPLPQRRTSEHASFVSYYDEITAALVAQRYRSDFDVLGYPRDITGAAASDLSPLGLEDSSRFVLDLSQAKSSRGIRFASGGGGYMSLVSLGPRGQLGRVTALSEGRIEPTAFDLVIAPAKRPDSGPVATMLDLFENREVEVLTDAPIPHPATNSEAGRAVTQPSLVERSRKRTARLIGALRRRR
ncbi:MAG: sulfotransferase family 2 domain-containing protein [Actinomycetota bacterium]